jgi:pimeloyl-ACP methyl ester carboxylesterase
VPKICKVSAVGDGDEFVPESGPSAGGALHPFRVHVPQPELDDLRARIRATRWPQALPGAGWYFGTDDGYLRDLCQYWAEEFDWRQVETQLNSWPQLTTEIDGARLHAIHARSPEPGAMPLLITHGWPGSVLEFLRVLGPLTDPAAHGGDPRDAFHVVCPSLPGYGWSGPTPDLGWDVRRVARAEAGLMSRLGYERYGAQGGDWGAFVTANLALAEPGALIGIHLNLVVAGPADPADPMAGLSAADQELVTAFGRYRLGESAYAMLQATKPQTLSFALNDSPAGLAAWIVEKFRTWSDCDGDLSRSFSRDDLLANITAYWLTGTAGSSGRLYAESARSGSGGGPMSNLSGFVDVPTACAIFPREIYRPPRAWAERQYRVERWTEFGHGGHFAAMEQPAELVDDIRAFFRPLR